MLLSETPIYETLKANLGKRISFSYRGKAKVGTLLLFSQRNFFIVFKIMDDNKKITSYEIPYPFAFEVFSDKIVLDYRLQNIFLKDDEMRETIESLIPTGTKKNKYCDFFDRIFTVSLCS